MALKILCHMTHVLVFEFWTVLSRVKRFAHRDLMSIVLYFIGIISSHMFCHMSQKTDRSTLLFSTHDMYKDFLHIKVDCHVTNMYSHVFVFWITYICFIHILNIFASWQNNTCIYIQYNLYSYISLTHDNTIAIIQEPIFRIFHTQSQPIRNPAILKVSDEFQEMWAFLYL